MNQFILSLFQFCHLNSLLICLMFLQAIPLKAQDGNTNPFDKCLSPEIIAEIATDFVQFKNLINRPLCDLNSKNYILISTLHRLKHLQFENNLTLSQDELFKNRIQFMKNWYNYFFNRIKTIDINNLGVCQSRQTAVAFVVAYSDKPILYTCNSFYEKRLTLIDRLQFLLHEARHKDGFEHVNCQQGPRKNMIKACDSRISDRGAYAVSVESLMQISKYSKNIHPALKKYAATVGLEFTQAFNEPVKVNSNDYLLIKTKQKKYFKLNTKNFKLKTVHSEISDGQMIHHNGLTVILPFNKKMPAKMYSNVHFTETQAESFTLNLYSQDPNKKDWVDINFDKTLAIIKKQSIDFYCRQFKVESKSTLKLPQNETALKMIYPLNIKNEFTNADYLMTESGQIYEIGCETERLNPYIIRSKLKFDHTYKRIYNLNGPVFGLGLDSKLYLLQKNFSQLLSETQNLEIEDIVPRQSFEFFE